MKEVKDDAKKWKDIPHSWIGRANIVKMFILPKAIYTFTAIPVSKYQQHFHRTRTILKFIWNHKRPRVAKAILTQKNKTGDITITDCKSYYKVVVVNMA